MPSFICAACGVGYEPAEQPPPVCPVCLDPRQFVPPGGQSWVTMESLARRHMNAWRLIETGLLAFSTQPKFAIGQRAFLLATPAGNILWDCVSLLDEATRDIVMALGGVDAIALSHPHFYATMVDWSQAFDNAPIFLHEDDLRWVARPEPAIHTWSGATHALTDGVTLVRCGGHFPGGAVLHWTGGADGAGALLTGDLMLVTPRGDSVSFMRSYPNLTPLSAPAVERIGAALEPFEYEAVHAGFFGRDILRGAKDIVRRSVRDYAAIVRGDGSAELL